MVDFPFIGPCHRTTSKLFSFSHSNTPLTRTCKYELSAMSGLAVRITLPWHLLTLHFNHKDGSGWTPLMIAASLRDGDTLVKLLLQKGADVNLKSKRFSHIHTLNLSNIWLATTRLQRPGEI